MGVYLGYVQTVANRLTVESVADTTLQWMQIKKLLENPSSVILSGFNEQSIDSMIQLVSRVAMARFIYPRIAPLFALANVVIGVVHLSVGFTQRFKTTEPASNTSKEWQEIALNIHKGFTHLLVAGYDFGIGFLLKQKYFDLGGVIAFATLPVVAYLWHQRMFKKPGDGFVPPASTDQSALVQKLIDVAAIPPNMADTVRSQFATLLTPTTAPASEKVLPKYLENTCYIYIIAKRFTLEMMPSVKKETEGLTTRVLKTCRRVSGIGVEEPLPDFGL